MEIPYNRGCRHLPSIRPRGDALIYIQRIKTVVGRRTGTIDQIVRCTSHTHEAIIELRVEARLDIPCNRRIGRARRCLYEDLRDLIRTTAQRVAQIGPQVVLQTVECAGPNEDECHAQ